jgi:ribosomal protein S18 acetylase RimI-like enzyme
MLIIRAARAEDHDAIWSIQEPIFRAGETYGVATDIDRDAALAYWLSAHNEPFVAEQDGRILGTYFIRPNYGGGGRHVANCGYMTAAAAQGKGVARAMLEHSLSHAKSRGYRAMQFNFVVSTNERAVAIWRAYGFEIVGQLPGAFEHPRLGFVDAWVMHKQL